jgi:O-antigen ligase
MNGWVGGGVQGVWKFSKIAVVLIFVGATVTNLQRMAWLRNMLLMVAVGFSLAGLIDLFQGVVGSPFIWVVPRTEEISPEALAAMQRLKGLGTLDDPNDFAQFLLVSLALLAGRGLDESSSFSRILRTALAGFLLVALIYTKSRGGVLGLVALIGLKTWDRFRWSGFIPVALAGLCAAPFISGMAGRDLSLQGGSDRLALWSDALAAFKHAPIFGNGFGTAPEILDLTTHNTYLLCLVELGIVGFIFWIGMVIVVMVPLWKMASKPIEGQEEGSLALRSWARAIRDAFVVFLVTSFFLSRAFEALFLAIVGMAFAIVQLDSNRVNPIDSSLPVKRWIPLAAAATIVSVMIPYIMVRAGRI